mmetsp:Transcript_60305/g.127702  ORF Transcript_60305/g.127702 Transcript_60305/m.127702 type:complete len:340 (+) Transcript_60305:49-1068(+)
MGINTQPLALRQYELTLQSAKHVLSTLLLQPSQPRIPFGALVEDILRSSTSLKQRSAACCIQRMYRRHCQLKRAAVAAVTPRKADFSLLRPRPPPPRSTGEMTAKPGLVALPPSKEPLNPLERRRLMVASQLAAHNPHRVARCRRAMFSAGQPPEGTSPAAPSPSGVTSTQSSVPPATAPASSAGLEAVDDFGWKAETMPLGRSAPLPGLRHGGELPSKPPLLPAPASEATLTSLSNPARRAGELCPLPPSARGSSQRELDLLLKECPPDSEYDYDRPATPLRSLATPRSPGGGLLDEAAGYPTLPGCGYAAGLSLGPPPAAMPDLRVKSMGAVASVEA